ncbi:MAG TPA: PAS domain S-box protein, partial [Urbifossiella sp.]|nr:PAS domain S-box protein [Urbifossiella sp.]
MGRTRDNGVLLGLGLVAAVLIGNAGLAYWNARHLRDDAGRAAHAATAVAVAAAAAGLALVGMLIHVVRRRLPEEHEARRAAEDAERRVRASEDRLRLFVEHTPAAVAMLDRDMRYLLVSHRRLRDYGLEGQDVIGRSYYEVFPNVSERWKEIHRRCLAGASERSEEDRFVRPDGQEV